MRLYHVAGNGSFDATLSWVLVVDASKPVSAPADLEMAGLVPSTADIQMAFLTVIGTPTGPQPLSSIELGCSILAVT